MKIFSYKEAKNIPENLLPSLVKSEIECWWSEPFSEYKICGSLSCKAIFSIEEVHWSLSNFKKWINNWDDFSCLECSWETEYIYKTDAFFNLIKDYIKWDVSAILLVTPEQNVEWFWVLSKTTLKDVVENEFATRPWSYDKKELSNILSKELFGIKTLSNKELICLHQIYISPDFRWIYKPFDVLKNMFLLREDDWSLPVVMETRYDSRFFPITKKMWFRDLVDDKYWYVVQYISNYLKLLNFLMNSKNLSKRKFYY